MATAFVSLFLAWFNQNYVMDYIDWIRKICLENSNFWVFSPIFDQQSEDPMKLPQSICPFVWFSVCPFIQSFFPKPLVELFWFFCMKLDTHLLEKWQGCFFKKKVLSWGFWAKKVQNGPKIRFFKFYLKLAIWIFLIFSITCSNIKSYNWLR